MSNDRFGNINLGGDDNEPKRPKRNTPGESKLSQVFTYADMRAALTRGIQTATASPQGLLIAAVGLIGVALSVVLLFLPVQDNLNGVSVACGSILSPNSTNTGAQFGCGGALADRAVEGGAYMIGGLGLLLLPFLSGSMARAFLLIGIAVTAASIINFFEGSHSLLSALGFLLALVMAILAGRRGLQKHVDVRQ